MLNIKNYKVYLYEINTEGVQFKVLHYSETRFNFTKNVPGQYLPNPLGVGGSYKTYFLSPDNNNDLCIRTSAAY